MGVYLVALLLAGCARSTAVAPRASAAYAPGGQSNKIVLELPITLPASAPVDADMRTECDTQAIVGNQILAKLKQGNAGAMGVQAAALPETEPFLRVRIMHAQMVEAIQWRRLRVEAQVMRGKGLVASTTLSSMTSYMPSPTMSACAVLERLAAKVGEGVAKWAPPVLERAAHQAR